MKRFVFAYALLALTGIIGVTSSQANAVTGADFQSGRIMDDSVFFNGNSIGPDTIQSFLNGKVPNCDTNGSQPYAGTTRAAYGTSRGNPPPYTCLRNYSQDTPTRASEPGLCNQYNGGLKSAASIIYDVGQACGISPKVLIVLLEKEQSLVTDDWPWNIQYRSATGFGCPDTAPCDAEYYGFFNQVYNAARQYKRYQRDESVFRYRSNRVNFIQYNPNAACGGGNVFIQNQATAGLYNYTPYQPNAAALNNLYGTGDGCSAYGNRNFWRIFNDWFGNIYGAPYYWQVVSQEAYSNSARSQPYTSTATTAPGSKIYLRIKARNQGFLAWDQSNTHIGTSRPQDRLSPFYDSSWITERRASKLIESSVAPGQVGTFEITLTAPQAAGSYAEYFNVVVEGQTWLNDIGLYYDINVVNPTQPISSINSQLPSGNEIKANEYILSQDTQSRLVLQPDGNLVLYTNFNNLVWASDTPGNSAGKLIMQPDGNLVLYSQTGTPLWHSNTYGNPGSRLVLQTDGNLVIYSPANAPIWSIGKTHNPNHLAYVNTTLYTTAMYPYQSLETANRKYKLVQQPDGNLVLYSPNRPLWASTTSGGNNSYLTLQPDGNLVLYNGSNQPLWHTGTNGRGPARLALQPDGNLVLYNGSNQPLWHTNTAGQQ